MRHVIARAPMIVDTDLGGDPDDTVALVVAARRVPELRLMVTSDEYGGERARLARYLLDLVGRPDVRVVAGSDLGNSRMWVMDGLCPAEVPRQDNDVVGVIDEVCSGIEGRIRWVGMGPLSNLARLQREAPLLIPRMAVTQMVGAINYRHPERAEHNFRAAPDARPWERVLREHFDRWTAKYPAMQHDSLTLAAAMLWPGVRFVRERVALDDLARMSLSADGAEIAMSISADYPAFMTWLEKALV